MALVQCSPCSHGHSLAAVLAVPPGSIVWDPACRDSRGQMRPHEIRAPKEPAK